MTSLFQARRRAEDFATAVDGRHDAHRAHGEEITALLGLVETLRVQEPVAPREEFASDLRSRLMLEAETALQPETATLLLPARERGRRERRMAVAASAFVLIGGTTTMAAAAQSALPGDALYPIKRGIERAETQLNLSAAGKGSDLLGQASDRLVEVEGLLAGDGAAQVPETLAEFTGSAREGADLLFESYGEDGEPGSIVEVRTFTAEGIAALEGIAGDVPAEGQDELTAAAIVLHDIDAEAAALCGTCAADLPPVEVPGIILARGEVDRALTLAANQELNNDHAIEVPADLLRRAQEQAGTLPRGTAPTAPAAPSGGETAAAPEAPAETPQWQPQDWPSLLPDLGGSTSDNDLPASGDDPVDPVDELADVVETLLPDTGSLLP